MKKFFVCISVLLISWQLCSAKGEIPYDVVLQYAVFAEKSQEGDYQTVRAFGRSLDPNFDVSSLTVTLFDKMGAAYPLKIVKLKKPYQFEEGDTEYWWYFEMPLDREQFGGGTLMHNQVPGSLDMLFVAFNLGSTPSPYDVEEAPAQ